ncbi:MAG: hypothetical protein A3E83_06695 [Gammaproteobacteria bacterium RIFCSPHIGHO2_12_FULL_41_20]|nr:MAG: hypothetical protein A3E83_06695 [Gammaproteobacteria bacterium RIFCSPHIGHO2_12_FULL_41_20]
MTKKIRSHGRIIATVYDLCAVMIAWAFAYWVIIATMADLTVVSYSLGAQANNIDKTAINFSLIFIYWKPILTSLCLILPTQFLIFRLFGLYRGFWRFASVQDLGKICYVSIWGCIIAWVTLRITTGNFLGISLVEKISFIPASSYITLFPRYIIALLYSIFLAGLLSSARLLVRFTKDYKQSYYNYKRVIIVGAGNAGEGLVRDLLRDNSHHYNPAAFIDDDIKKNGREIHGVRVVGATKDLPTIISKYHADLVLIAIPSASSANMRTVVDLCTKANVPCYTLPGIKDLANGRVSISILRSISLEDLLGRYPVTCPWSEVRSNLKNKTILITGGGGSIGSEISRQVASINEIAHLVIIDNNEYNLYSIDMELRKNFPSCSLHTVLLSITDRIGIQILLNKYRPNLIFHAAAYKHVPLLEHQPRTAIYNNIVGTRIIAEEAIEASVEKFVLISTDKAVNPSNIMGATKRAAEYFCQGLNHYTQVTRFITVRFGNVLNSAGSVVPLFRKQIEEGGPVTVTHPEITRFFMTIPEASQLILQATFLGQGGEIFVLDMGEPVKISYLAEQMIKLAGKVVNQDIKITYTGLRPGEKLYEECFYSHETLQPTPYKKILQTKSQYRDFNDIKSIYTQLEKLCLTKYVDNFELIRLLKTLVSEYKIATEVTPSGDDKIAIPITLQDT